MRDHLLEELWQTAPPTTARFDPASIAALPPAARRYLEHALAPGAPLATAMRVDMHGELKLGDAWHDFTAEQVLRWDRGFVWHAKTRMKGLPVSGSDRLVDGEGVMRWKMLGLVLVMSAEGPDIARSGAGRLHAESLWMPGVLLGEDTVWSGGDEAHPHAVIRAHGELSELELAIAPDGALSGFKLARWGKVDDTPFHYEDFGGSAANERTFDGITIPTSYRVGWFYGSERFEAEGEFIRLQLDRVTYC